MVFARRQPRSYRRVVVLRGGTHLPSLASLAPQPSHSRIHPPFLPPCPLRPLSGISSLYPPLPSLSSALLARLPFLRLCSACRDPSIRPSLYLRSVLRSVRLGIAQTDGITFSSFFAICANSRKWIIAMRQYGDNGDEGCVLRNRDLVVSLVVDRPNRHLGGESATTIASIRDHRSELRACYDSNARALICVSIDRCID